MSQIFDSTKPTSGVTTFGELYQVIIDHNNALRSAFSGVSFPTNAVNGQPCWRTDRGDDGILYVYTGNTSRGESGWISAVEASDIGQELINARGTKSSLDQRLDVVLNEDGTLKSTVEAYQSEWVKPSLTFTYLTTTSFEVEGDQTDIYIASRRLKINLSGSVVYSEVISATYSTSTTITIADSVIDSTLVDVEHSIIKPSSESGSLTPSMINAYTKEEVDSEVDNAIQSNYGFKNYIINGDKRVNQREYADGVLTDGEYGYDRWKGSDSDANIEQVIEQQNITTGTYTISWIGGGTATVNGTTGLASGDSLTITVIGYVSVVVPKDATNIQLEEGSVATPFEQRPYGLELSLCQRYLPYRSKIGISTLVHGSGRASSSQLALIEVPSKVTSRAIPTSVTYLGNFELKGGGASSYDVTNISIQSNQCSEDTIVLACSVSSGLLNTSTYQLRNKADTTAYIEISTEL